MYKKILFLLIFSVFLFIFSFSVFAEEGDILAEELNIREPGLISWFSNIIDTVRIWTARDPVKKAELELKKASRQIIRAREMVQENTDDVNLEAKLEMVNSKYRGLINKINDRVEQYKKNNPEVNDKLKNFLNKYTEYQLKHQEILQKLEEQAPEEIVVKIQENRQEHLEKFSEVMTRLQDKEEFKELLKNVLENSKNAIQQTSRIKLIEELGEQDVLEIRQRIKEVKQENRRFFSLDKFELKDEDEDEDIDIDIDIDEQDKDNNSGELTPN